MKLCAVEPHAMPPHAMSLCAVKVHGYPLVSVQLNAHKHMQLYDVQMIDVTLYDVQLNTVQLYAKPVGKLWKPCGKTVDKPTHFPFLFGEETCAPPIPRRSELKVEDTLDVRWSMWEKSMTVHVSTPMWFTFFQCICMWVSMGVHVPFSLLFSVYNYFSTISL